MRTRSELFLTQLVSSPPWILEPYHPMTLPYSIRIFLPGGDPDGLRTIEKSNWTGSGIVLPRALLGASKGRRELGRTGVYVLVGPSEESGLPRLYVGEGDPVGPRLEQHASKKDFWTTAIAFTGKDDNLNKAHVQHLESRLIRLAQDAKRCVLDNGNLPTLPSLSEADAADAEGFLAEMLLCFPVLGLGVFHVSTTPSAGGPLLFINSKGIQASGVEAVDGFLVKRGSEAVKEEVESIHRYMSDLRKALVGNGVLVAADGRYVFSQDYLFASPSTAAGVIQGSAANGRLVWKTADGKSLRSLQEEGGES
jgi:hypothetical protein